VRPLQSALFILCWLSGSVWAATPAQKGIALGLFAEDPGFSYGPLLKEISATGASHVSLVVPLYQRDLRSTRIYAHPRFSPPDEVLKRTLKQAREAGLRVLLFPILRLERAATPDEWRGAIRPDDAEKWWRSYSAWMLRFARLAQQYKVDLLCVGSELSTMDREVKRWEPLIRSVRQAYSGKLVYSANWDHYQQVKIWHLVDLAGLSAYFQLTAPGERNTLQRLAHAWREQRVRISRWRVQINKPLVFTELGYHSQRGTGSRPWDENAALPIDLQEQARCYQAFIRVWRSATYLQGVYFWNWFGWGGPQSREYCPRGKPAVKAICKWYGVAKDSCPKRWGFPREVSAP